MCTLNQQVLNTQGALYDMFSFVPVGFTHIRIIYVTGPRTVIWMKQLLGISTHFMGYTERYIVCALHFRAPTILRQIGPIGTQAFALISIKSHTWKQFFLGCTNTNDDRCCIKEHKMLPTYLSVSEIFVSGVRTHHTNRELDVHIHL